MSLGMNRHSGRWLSSYEHLQQSIQILLTTAIGTRVERRHIGSLVPELIDYPSSNYYTLLLFAAVTSAISKHEPRLTITQISTQTNANKKGQVELVIDGFLTDLSEISLEVSV